MLEWFGTVSDAAHLSDVARALNMPKSSALLMLRVLVDRGYLQKGGDGSYSLIHLPGYHAIQAGRHGALKVFATPILEEAVHSAGETGILAAVDGHNIRFLRKCLPGQQIVCDPAIGATPRLEEDACGIAILMASVPAVIAR